MCAGDFKFPLYTCVILILDHDFELIEMSQHRAYGYIA